jgi:hypothetical protein
LKDEDTLNRGNIIMEKTGKFKMINDEVLDSVSGGVEIR